MIMPAKLATVLCEVNILPYTERKSGSTSNLSGNEGNGQADQKTYYHVTTQEAAEQIIASGQLKKGNFEVAVFAWTQQPTKRQALLAGIGDKSAVVIKFDTKASFSEDTGVHNTLRKIAVQSSSGTRYPIEISNVSIIGFKKAWWRF